MSGPLPGIGQPGPGIYLLCQHRLLLQLLLGLQGEDTRGQTTWKKKAEPPVSSLVSSSEFKCTQCDSLFKSGEELKIHIDDMHASSELKTPEKERSHPPTSDLSLTPVLGEGREEPPSSQLVDPPSPGSLEKFKCDICGETFIGKTLKSALRYHMQHAHGS